jgi:hypothetical protein
MEKRIVGASIIVLCSAAAIGAFWAAPPLKLAAPGLFGLECAERVCVEQVEDLRQARELFATAAAAVETQTGLAVPRLNAVLCRSEDCYRRFGGGDERAISYPFLGTVIAGRSWQDYIIRHELIHWLQFEHFGAFETMRQPVWFREGMAYALSGAPDHDIPEPFKPWMAQYRGWQGERSPAAIFLTQPVLD